MTIFRSHSFIPSDPRIRAKRMAEKLHTKLQSMGVRQVRLHDGMLLTYPYPSKRGYGTRGVLIGIYNASARLEWIEEDLLQAMLFNPLEIGSCT